MTKRQARQPRTFFTHTFNMAKNTTNPVAFADMIFPQFGLNISLEFDRQIRGTTPLGNNVRFLDPGTLRSRGAARPGLSKYLDDQPGGLTTLIQHLAIIVDPTVDGLISDDDEGDIVDPSTSNRKRRQPIGPPVRKVRRGGSGRQPNIKIPRPILTITAQDQTKDQGDTFTFAGTEFTSSGLQILDTANSAIIRSTGSKASAMEGTYPIKISSAQGTVAEGGLLRTKYKIVYVPGMMTVSAGVLVEFVLTIRVRFVGVGTTYEANGSIDGDMVGSVTVSGDDPELFRYHTWSTGATRPSGLIIAGIDDGNTGNFPILAGMRSLTAILNASIGTDGTIATFGITKCEDGSPVDGNQLVMADPVTGSNPYGPLLFNVDYTP